jgi:hypothetical protein
MRRRIWSIADDTRWPEDAVTWIPMLHDKAKAALEALPS